MANERQKLTSLSDRLARKVVPAEQTPAPVALEQARAGKVDDRVQIIVRMTAAERKALRQIALDQDTTAQALAEEAIRNVLHRHGHRPQDF